MQCPSCDAKLKELKLDRFSIPGCKSCDGIWIEKKDLNPFFKYLITLKNNGKKLQESSGIENELLNGQRGRYCPYCGNPTELYEWGDSGVVSFACREQCGVWVRFKQLGNIVEWYEAVCGMDRTHRFFIIKEKDNSIISDDSNLAKGLVGWMNDDIKVTTTPIVVITLIILNTLCFALNFVLKPETVLGMCLVPAKFVLEPIEYSYTLITSQFFHGGIGHLFGNMFFLYLFGKSLEDRLGKLKFTLLYLSGGIIAALAHVSFTTLPQIPTLGASGAISGVMAGYLVLFPKAKISFHRTFFLYPFKIVLPAWFYLGIWFVAQQLLGILSDAGGIAWYAHFFGFVYGFVIVFLLKKTEKL